MVLNSTWYADSHAEARFVTYNLEVHANADDELADMLYPRQVA